MPQSNNSALVLIIDNEELVCDGCRLELEKAGFEVLTSNSVNEGISLARERKPDIVFFELNMPGMSEVNIFDILLSDIPDIVIVVITAYATIDSAVKVIKNGAYDYLSKPFKPEHIISVANRCMEHRNLKIEARHLREERQIYEKGFITFVSHEMRSPLIAVQQYLESMVFLSKKDSNQQFLEILNKCSIRIKNLEDLVNHWLDLERVESKAFVSSKSELNIKEIILSAIDDLAPISEKRGINVTMVQPPQELPLIMGDRQSLLRVIINIIGNATKYTAAGGSITSRISFDDFYVKVEIADTGKGIAPEKLQFIFEPFFRVLGNKEPYRGSGLGLTFCKKIMDAHNGRIEVSSKVGSGTVFVLKFPRQ